MKVAIAGAGNVGVYIAGDLRDAGHDVMVIEQDPDLVARLRSTLDVRWFIADACEVSSLHEAELETVLAIPELRTMVSPARLARRLVGRHRIRRRASGHCDRVLGRGPRDIDRAKAASR